MKPQRVVSALYLRFNIFSPFEFVELVMLFTVRRLRGPRPGFTAGALAHTLDVEVV